MKYALIENKKVIQVSYSKADGYIEVGDHVFAGMIDDDGDYTSPLELFDTLREVKKSELESACKESIVNTLFESDALGSTHSYDCRPEDQSNLSIAVAAGEGDEIYAHTQPAFKKKLHDHSQCVQLARDMRTHIQGCRDKRDALLIQVNAITEDAPENRALLEDITW